MCVLAWVVFKLNLINELKDILQTIYNIVPSIQLQETFNLRRPAHAMTCANHRLSAGFVINRTLHASIFNKEPFTLMLV
jgi:hypothetical protein